MTSFKETGELTLLCYAENLLSDDEFLVLWENNQSSNPDFPWDGYGPFDLENIDEAECRAEFCVEKRDLPTLREVLGISNAHRGLYAIEWKDCACYQNDLLNLVVTAI